MSTTESNYIQETGEGENKVKTILDDAFISTSNVSDFKYTFDNPTDITDKLLNNKKKQGTFSNHKGRTGFAELCCTYPDKTYSNKLFLMGVVAQYIKAIEKPDNPYGKDYIFIGIPSAIITELQTQAKVNSGITVKPKAVAKEQGGYWWVSCNLDSVSTDDMYMSLPGKAEDSIDNVKWPIDDILRSTKQHVLCNMTFNISASITTPSLQESLDLKNGEYHFSIKPLTITARKEVDVDAPMLQSADRKATERPEPSTLNLADPNSKLAELAFARLNIQGTK